MQREYRRSGRPRRTKARRRRAAWILVGGLAVLGVALARRHQRHEQVPLPEDQQKQRQERRPEDRQVAPLPGASYGVATLPQVRRRRAPRRQAPWIAVLLGIAAVLAATLVFGLRRDEVRLDAEEAATTAARPTPAVPSVTGTSPPPPATTATPITPAPAPPTAKPPTATSPPAAATPPPPATKPAASTQVTATTAPPGPAVPAPPRPRLVQIEVPSTLRVGTAVTASGSLGAGVDGPVTIEARWGGGPWRLLARAIARDGAYRIRYSFSRSGNVQVRISHPNGTYGLARIRVVG